MKILKTIIPSLLTAAVLVIFTFTNVLVPVDEARADITLWYLDGTTLKPVDATWTVAGITATPGGSNTQVQFNDSSTMAGDAGFTYNKTTDTATLAGNIVAEDLLLEDSDASHNLTITTTSNLTAGRTLTLVPGDAARTITINGDPTLNDWFDQGVKTTSNVVFNQAVIGGATIASDASILGVTSMTITDAFHFGAAGVKLSADGDGAITFLGLGNGFDEDLTLNLDDTENTGVFTSSTLLATLNFSGIALQESGIAVLNNDEIDASSELLAIMDDETGTGLLTFATSPTFTTSIVVNGAGTDPADAGAIRLNNTDNIAWEAAPAGTDFTIGVDSGEILQISGAVNAFSLTLTTALDISGDTNLTAGRSLTLTDDDVFADAELYTDTKCYRIENPIATDDDKSIWFAKNAFTITSIWAESDQTVTFMLQVDDGTPADVDSVDLAPAAGTAEDTALNGDATMAAGDRLDLDIASVASTPTWVAICWTGSWDD